MLKSSLKKGIHAAALVFLAACVDGDSPTGVGVPRAVALGALPSFAVIPTAAELAVLDSARVRLVNVPNDSLVADTVFLVDPSVSEWVFPLTIQLSSEQSLSLSLSVELFDIDLGFESVEFSGRTEAPFDVQASLEPKEIRAINLHRGPLINLDLTMLEMVDAPDRLQEGGTTVLELAKAGAAPGQIIYFRSVDPNIASVDSLGNVKAWIPGDTEILVYAGRHADTLDLHVGQVNLPSAAVLRASVLPQIDYVSEDVFLRSFADPAAVGAIKDALGELSTEMLAGRGFQSVEKFEAVEAVWETYGKDTNLRFLDGPQLGVITLALIRAADVLEIEFE